MYNLYIHSCMFRVHSKFVYSKCIINFFIFTSCSYFYYLFIKVSIRNRFWFEILCQKFLKLSVKFKICISQNLHIILYWRILNNFFLSQVIWKTQYILVHLAVIEKNTFMFCFLFSKIVFPFFTSEYKDVIYSLCLIIMLIERSI